VCALVVTVLVAAVLPVVTNLATAALSVQ